MTSTVARRVARFVVDTFQIVQIQGDERHQWRVLARQPTQFVHEIGPVLQLGQHVVLAQIFQISFGLLARRDVGQGHQHLGPVLLAALKHRELQMDVQQIALQRAVLYFLLVKQPAFPKVDQLFGKRSAGFIVEDIAEPRQQFGPRGRLEHLQGVVVDVQDADLLEAAIDEFLVHIQKGPEIGDATDAQLVE